MAHILIVDDEETIRSLLKGAMERRGHEVTTANDGSEGAAMYSKCNPDVIISDVKMPVLSGFQMIEKLQADGDISSPIVFITGHGDKAAAVDALRRGAFDYIEKPFEMDELVHVVDRAIKKTELLNKNKDLSNELSKVNVKLAEQLAARTELVRRIQTPNKSDKFNNAGGFSIKSLGNSISMQPVVNAIERLSKSNLGASMSVLVTGPSGCGKEIVARLLHELSPRSKGPWVPLNCGALPEALIEAELFGHEKGAFTGATARKPGVFEMADGGTLFLDEIGELPLNMQTRLLRALQEQKFRRVGGTSEIEVNVRVVAATNKDLKSVLLIKHSVKICSID